MAEHTREELQMADQKLQAGVKQYLTSPIILGGKPTTASDLGAVIQGRIDARTATDVAAATYHSKVVAERASISGSKVLLEQAKAVLLVMFASTPEALAAMGLSERKSTKLSIADKAEAQAKAEATRKARHTMGPKAKRKVTGVTAEMAALATAATASASAAPAPAAPVAPALGAVAATGKASS